VEQVVRRPGRSGDGGGGRAGCLSVDERHWVRWAASREQMCAGQRSAFGGLGRSAVQRFGGGYTRFWEVTING
jgi:hypothetical protein